ncbi:hypothetical protein D9M69_542310 [compost metagenome]
MPSAAQAMARPMRTVMRSRRKSQLATATTAGIDAMITPADTALVRLTPNSMQIENRKLPRKDSRKTSPRVRVLMGGSSGLRWSQWGMASAAMPKRSHASSSTGKAATSGLERAT